MKLTIILRVLVPIVFIVSILSCSLSKYNVNFFDNAINFLNANFINENKLLQNNNTVTDKYFIVKTSDIKDRVFKDNTMSVNLNNQIVIIYTFISISKRPIVLSKIEKEDSLLKISYKYISKSNIGDACAPYQRWFFITLNKIQIDTIYFEEL